MDEPPYDAFSRHTTDPNQPHHSRLIDPRWLEVHLSTLRDRDDMQERIRRLQGIRRPPATLPPGDDDGAAKGNPKWRPGNPKGVPKGKPPPPPKGPLARPPSSGAFLGAGVHVTVGAFVVFLSPLSEPLYLYKSILFILYKVILSMFMVFLFRLAKEISK